MKSTGVCLLTLSVAALAGCATTPGARTGAELALRHRADTAYALGDSAGALSAYQRLAARGAGDAAVWTRIGDLEVLENRPHEATAAYTKAVAIDPMATEAWHNMAIIRFRQAEAMLDEERASLKPGDPRASAIEREQARLAAVQHGTGPGLTECGK